MITLTDDIGRVRADRQPNHQAVTFVNILIVTFVNILIVTFVNILIATFLNSLIAK